jgi:hypothetical protein
VVAGLRVATQNLHDVVTGTRRNGERGRGRNQRHEDGKKYD